MGSTRDFVRSTLSDALLPATRQLLEDVVMEVLNDRQVPSRTDFQELRDLVNGMRTQASGAASSAAELRRQLAALEQRVATLEAENAALRAKAPRRAKKGSTTAE